MQAPNTGISFHKSNIKIPENRKLNVSKNLYECGNGLFQTMQNKKTAGGTLLQKKKKKRKRTL